MFRDDAIRYVNKSRTQGVRTELQIWQGMVHVWHAFELPESTQAFARIEAFLADWP